MAPPASRGGSAERAAVLVVLRRGSELLHIYDRDLAQRLVAPLGPSSACWPAEADLPHLAGCAAAVGARAQQSSQRSWGSQHSAGVSQSYGQQGSRCLRGWSVACGPWTPMRPFFDTLGQRRRPCPSSRTGLEALSEPAALVVRRPLRQRAHQRAAPTTTCPSRRRHQ